MGARVFDSPLQMVRVRIPRERGRSVGIEVVSHGKVDMHL